MEKVIFRLMLALILTLTACSNNPKISTGTLLEEMIDRNSLSEFPQTNYTTKQFSSYDRNSVSPDSLGWFANADRSHFIRIEEHKGRREFVMVDAHGPGAIVRIWITVASYKGNGTIRFYIDGNEEPELEGEVLKMMSGGGIVDAPLATSVSKLTDYDKRGHNLYLPIAYEKHIKITYESESVTEKAGAERGEAFYYNINYRTYTDNVSLNSFSKEDLTTYASELNEVQQKLSTKKAEIVHGDEKVQKNKVTLKSQQKVAQKIEGEKAIKRLSIKLDAENYEQALRSTILEIKFDNEQTVWCPIGDFFGTGYKLSPYKTWYTDVTPEGILSCNWVMPFSNSAEVTIRNLGDQEVKIDDFTVETSTYTWTDRSMYFGAGWFEQNRLKTVNDGVNSLGEDHGHFDVNYVTLTGKGVMVGNSVTLFNTIDAWWGEGDEKIFVDNESFPSHFGTGTEDYYGYAWSNPAMFEHPYIAQPDGSGAINSGHVVNLRYRGLDVIPFNEKIQVDVEMWHWLKTTINHAPVSYWYMLPGGKSNIEPQPEAAKKGVALSRMDFFLDGYYDRNIFMKKTKVEIKGHENGYEIRYTLDGSIPTRESELYTEPFKLNKSTIVKSIGFLPNGYTTEILEGEFIRQSPIKEVKLKNPKLGLSYSYLESTEVIEFMRQIRGFKTTSSGVVPTFEFPKIKLSGIFGMVVTGYVKVPKRGIYTFSTNTNDGSMLYIHDQLVVNNDGGHGARERVGQVALRPGYHPIKLEYFQMGGGKLLEIFMEGPGIERHQLKSNELFQ